MKRKQSTRKRLFKETAKRTRTINILPPIMRGGFRL